MPDRPTVANLTNHVYFNLAGSGTVGCHILAVEADHYVATDARKLPTGDLPLVDTGRDFRSSRLLGEALAAGGLDEMLVLRARGAARLADAVTGRSLTIATNQPGLQVFTGNSLDGSDHDRNNVPIVRHAGIALEPGHFSDSPWFAHFPSTLVTPARPLRWHARWTFTQDPQKQAECRA